MPTLAYECYAEGDVFFFLRDHCKLPIQKLHSYSQGEVVKHVFVENRAEIGMVDEDPGKSHHRLRDQAQIISASEDLELRRREGRHLIVVKPELEECFLRSMNRLGLASRLGAQSRELQTILNTPDHPKHAIFRDELVVLYRESKTRGVETFVTYLEDCLRRLFGLSPR